jgi:hypothetical protein
MIYIYIHDVYIYYILYTHPNCTHGKIIIFTHLFLHESRLPSDSMLQRLLGGQPFLQRQLVVWEL